jgi:ADP-ribose pyrophosphatase YjhB (NUDIX family)
VVIPAAGAIIFDEGGRLLLIRRARPPAAGFWSVPGGKCEPDEDPAAACVREVAEETGLTVSVVRFAGRVSRSATANDSYVIDNFVCKIIGGELRAADDAADAGWFSAVDIVTLPLYAGLFSTLAEWGLLPD